jgi:septal ring factor EnvC (AmiA/AmiB activator)
MKIIFFVFLTLSFSAFATVPTDSAVLESETINVDGYLEKAPDEDPELAQIKGEIQKQKKEIVLNKVKAKKFQELSKSIEKLSETTEEYLEEKRAAQEQIAEYNLKVRCLQAESPGPECEKFHRR